MKFALIFFLSFSVFAKEYNLQEIYELSLKNLHIDEQEKQNYQIASSLKNQVRGSLFPTLSLRGIYTEIEPLPETNLNAFTRSNQYNYGLRLSQPLFRGGAEYATLNKAQINLKLSESQAKTQKLKLYLDIIDLYFNYIYLEQDLKNLNELVKYSLERVNEINSRVQIGRVRKGELLEAQSQYSRVLVNYEEALRNFEFITIKIQEMTGLKEFQLKDEVFEISFNQSEVELNDRPEVQNLNYTLTMTDEDLTISRGSHWPELNFEVNKYFNRTGILEDSTWDFVINLNWKIFEGGIAMAKTDEALARKRLTMIELKNLKNNLTSRLQQIKSDYVNYEKQLELAEKSLKSSEKAWSLSQSDYRLGLISNLDVLTSLNNFIETKRLFQKLRIQKTQTAYLYRAEQGIY